MSPGSGMGNSFLFLIISAISFSLIAFLLSLSSSYCLSLSSLSSCIRFRRFVSSSNHSCLQGSRVEYSNLLFLILSIHSVLEEEEGACNPTFVLGLFAKSIIL
ncbi:hypothetical protein [Crucivirus-474]|nr:hypothetical protein [Crucivirus-474]